MSRQFPGNDDLVSICELMFPHNQVVEVRVLGFGGRDGKTAAGWFNDWGMLSEAVAAIEKRGAKGIYCTLNPVDAACLSRAANRLQEYQKQTTTDKDITGRNWLPLDFDPVRPAGISSTNDELILARDKMFEVCNWLEGEMGWPAGIKACSGNGAHAPYVISLPNDDASRDLVKGVLEALASKFDDERVKVDTSVYNAARIWKLYGTWTRKGDHTADRPHRKARIWLPDVPTTFADLTPVSLLQLQALVSKLDTGKPTIHRQPAARSNPHRKSIVDLERFIADHSIAVKREESWRGTGRRYILEHCLFDPSHIDSSACLGRSEAGAVFYKCQHNSCQNRGWQDVRELYGYRVKSGRPPKEPRQSDDNPYDLARQMIEEELTDADTGALLIRRHRETWYRYEMRKHCYVLDDREMLRGRVINFLSSMVDKVTKNRTADVIDCLAAQSQMDNEHDLPIYSEHIGDAIVCYPDKRRWISLKNGILDIDAVLAGETMENCLRPHTPNWVSTITLTYGFPTTEQEAECPLWLDFLNTIFLGNQSLVDVLQEAFGCCFVPTAFEKIFLLHGGGQNGKSQLLLTLKAMLGEKNVTALSIPDMKSSTMPGALYGKLANICGDLPRTDDAAEDMLKRLSSGDTITVDRKYKTPLHFQSTAKLFFATNHLPVLNDHTDGIWRRLLLIPFNWKVPEEKKVSEYHKVLCRELPGILWWSLHGLARLVKRDRFVEPEICREARMTHQRKCFPILQFLMDCCEMEGETHAFDLWKTYRAWCETYGLSKPKPYHRFLDDLCGYWKHVQLEQRPRMFSNDLVAVGITMKQGISFLPA